MTTAELHRIAKENTVKKIKGDFVALDAQLHRSCRVCVANGTEAEVRAKLPALREKLAGYTLILSRFTEFNDPQTGRYYEETRLPW